MQVGQIECEVLRRASIASSAPAGGKAHVSAIRTRPHQAQRGTNSPRSNSVQIAEKRPEVLSASQATAMALGAVRGRLPPVGLLRKEEKMALHDRVCKIGEFSPTVL